MGKMSYTNHPPCAQEIYTLKKTGGSEDFRRFSPRSEKSPGIELQGNTYDTCQYSPNSPIPYNSAAW